LYLHSLQTTKEQLNFLTNIFLMSKSQMVILRNGTWCCEKYKSATKENITKCVILGKIRQI